MFRVDPKTVTRWAKAGKLTSIRTLGDTGATARLRCGRCWRVSRSSVRSSTFRSAGACVDRAGGAGAGTPRRQRSTWGRGFPCRGGGEPTARGRVSRGGHG
ncbi:hypothetical protein [Actinomadura keratinilytica]|uniref:hypothetical protein n=1 Tax=Actinomadura keratinilytica TaxID=547461 RepID=UPI00361D5D76